MRHADSVRLGSVLPMTLLITSLAPIYAADQESQADTGREITATGRIVKVRPAEHQLTLQTTKGKELELNIGSHSQLTHDRQPAKLSEFHEGARVRVTYEPAEGKNRVLTLRDAPVTAEEVQQELRNAFEAVKNYSYQQKQEYQKRLEPVLQDLDERIDHLKEQAKGAGKEASKWYAQSLQELRRERRIVRERLAKVQAAAPGAWDEIKAGVGAAWNDLRQAFERANARMKEGNQGDHP